MYLAKILTQKGIGRLSHNLNRIILRLPCKLLSSKLRLLLLLKLDRYRNAHIKQKQKIKPTMNPN